MNPRYLNFTQQHYTAGDEDQFESRRNKVVFNSDCPNPCISSEIEYAPQIRYEHYRDLRPSDVVNTFRYIFHKVKKGMFIQFHQNQLSVMLPFSKHNFINEWSDRIAFDPAKYVSWNDLFRASTEAAGFRFKCGNVHQHREKWYANNGLLRYEYPIHEGETGVDTIDDMLRALCAERCVPDMEVFINRRDFPILRKNGTEPYTCLFGTDIPLVSHKYDRYVPILSACTSPDFADIPIPTPDDWGHACAYTGSYCTDWDDKLDMAIFRGSTTGLGTTPETNPRLYVAKLDERDILDAGITKLNTRPRKSVHAKWFDIPDIRGIDLAEPLTAHEQSRYKYIVNVPGHVCAFRLSRELSYGSVILLVRSDYQMWYSHLLKPYVHYVPVKADASDLIDRIQWCMCHDLECRTIAQNAIAFWNTHLSRGALLDHLQSILVRIKQRCGTYMYRVPSVMDSIQEFEETRISMNINSANRIPTFPLPEQLCKYATREHSFLVAFSWVFHKYPNIVRAYYRKPIHNANRHRTMDTLCIGKLHLLRKPNPSTHELFVGLECINFLLRYVPNFSYTFGTVDGDMYTEFFADSITLFEYIQSQNFSMDVFLEVLLQVGFALNEAQIRYGFVHWDLAAWNIVLRKREEPTTISYYLPPKEIATISATYDVIIVDYENAHCVVDGIHCGKTHPFQIDTVHDILSLLFTSLHSILKYCTLDKHDLSRLFLLTTFFSGTSYTNNVMFKNIRDLRIFLNRAKKFSELLLTPKGTLSKRTPLDFVQFLHETLDMKFEVSNRLLQKRISSPLEEYSKLCDQPVENPLFNIPVNMFTPIQKIRLYNRLVHTDIPNAVLSLIESSIYNDDDDDIPVIPKECTYTEDTLEDGTLLSPDNASHMITLVSDQMDRLEFVWNTRDKRYWTRRWWNRFQLCSVNTHRCIASVHTLEFLNGLNK